MAARKTTKKASTRKKSTGAKRPATKKSTVKKTSAGTKKRVKKAAAGAKRLGVLMEVAGAVLEGGAQLVEKTLAERAKKSSGRRKTARKT